jgi:hypothetical protein
MGTGLRSYQSKSRHDAHGQFDTDAPEQSSPDSSGLMQNRTEAVQAVDYLQGSEYRFRDHAMDALAAVHYLGDVIIDGDAGDHIGLLARKFGEPLGDENDGFAHCHLHRLFEVGVKPHYDPVGGGLGARPCDLHVLAHDELELAAQSGLDGGKVDLALTLAAWASPTENSAPGAYTG